MAYVDAKDPEASRFIEQQLKEYMSAANAFGNPYEYSTHITIDITMQILLRWILVRRNQVNIRLCIGNFLLLLVSIVF